ncbi:MAG: hypothetical protein LUC22_02930 [Prevotella sp.]|nr:hypothetical protein [Prevotella sp.]
MTLRKMLPRLDVDMAVTGLDGLLYLDKYEKAFYEDWTDVTDPVPTVADLCMYTEADLRTVPLPEKTIDDIAHSLMLFRLRLGMSEAELNAYREEYSKYIKSNRGDGEE